MKETKKTTTKKKNYRRQDDDVRGRHLVAARCLSQNEVIFCERPLCSLQSLENLMLSNVLVCRHCRSFCGTPSMHLQLLSGNMSRQDVLVAAVSTNEEEKESSSLSPLSKNNNNKYGIVPCRQGCGEVFCSKECEQDSWPSHSLLCTGLIPDDDKAENHPLLQWKRHAVENNEIFLLVGDVISSILAAASGDDDDAISVMEEKVKDFTMVPWWDVVMLLPQHSKEEEESKTTTKETAAASSLAASCQRLCTESADLLRQALSLQNNVKNIDLVTPLFVSQIIGSFEQNSMGIRSRHPLCRYILEHDNFRHEHISNIIQCLEREGFIGNDDDDDEEEDEEDSSGSSEQNTSEKQIDTEDVIKQGEEEPIQEHDGISASSSHSSQNYNDDKPEEKEEEWEMEYSPEEIDTFLAGLNIENIHDDSGDDLDILFPPLDGTAMYSTACKMNHSCDPNVVVLYRDRPTFNDPLVVHCIARRDIAEGEELCISYIETNQPYLKRQEDLANYGFTCHCSRCESETNQECVQATSTPKNNSIIDEDDLFGNDDDDGNDDIDEDDLFGTDDDEDEEGADDDDDDSNNSLVGTEALKEKYEQIMNVSDASLVGAMPPSSFGEVHSFVVQQGKQGLESVVLRKEDDMATELVECIAAIKVKKFHTCVVCGSHLEKTLYQILQKEKSWPDASYRQVYWVATVSAAAGLAQRGSYLESQKMLDKANILGLDLFRTLPSFTSFVARYAFEVYQKPSGTITTSTKAMEINVQTNNNNSSFETCLTRPIRHPITEVGATIDLEEFENRFVINEKAVVIRELAQEWRATSKWRNLSFFSQNYGHRLIPIELGSILSEGGMEENLITVYSFISEHLGPSCTKGVWTLDDAISNPSSYMAQHALLDQIPSLRDDVEAVPHLCGTKTNNPLINIWMGTGGTRTPLHFDSYDNILVQVVGAKYVRIYDKEESAKLYVITKDSSTCHASQGNMSAVNCEQENWEKHPLAKDANYVEVVLMPGDAIFIPSGAWHYVRSLSTSISINYWWS